MLIAPAAAAEQPAAAPLTDQQREQLLAQRDRLMEQAGQLQKEGKPAEAMGPARQVLAIDRQLYGASHVEVAMALEWLARLAEAAGDFASAIPLREEEVEMGARLFGKDHWLVAEPRLALEHARLVMRLDPAARERLAAARPASLGQALRVSSITPADITVLAIHLARIGAER